MRTSLRGSRWIAPAAAAAILLWVVPAAAQKTTFNPSILLEQGHDDNVFYSGGQTQSDEMTRVTAELPVRREWRTGSLDFNYRPSLLRYSDFDDLDRDEHDMRVRWRHKPNQRTELRFDAGLRRTQEQGDAGSIEDTDLFIGRRADRDRLRAAFDVERQMSQRWSWGVNVSGSTTEYDLVLDPMIDPSELDPPEDKSDYGADIRFERNVTRTQRIGGRYGHREFDLDLSGDESDDTLSFLWEKEIDERSTFGLAAGAFRSDGEAADGSGADDERTGALMELNYTRLYDRARLTLNASHLPNSGGVLQGTATTSILGATLASVRTRVWRWRISPRVTQRDPSDDTDFDRTTYGLSARVERVISARFGVRLRGRWIEQTNDDPDVADRSSVEAHLGFVWYPLGGTALGG